MELVECTQNIYMRSSYDWIEPATKRLLFKKGNVYPVFCDACYWFTTDEDGAQHIIADYYENEQLTEDPWFALHFRML